LEQDNLPKFGADTNEYLPSLKDGAKIVFKILTAPEKYESLYGEKIRLEIRVDGNNDKSSNIKLYHKYTVSSSATCWRALEKAWGKAEEANEIRFLAMTWRLIAKEITLADGETRTIYILEAIDGAGNQDNEDE